MRGWWVVIAVVAVTGCKKSYGEENVANCNAFEADCPGIETARDGIYAECNVFGSKDAEELCDYNDFFACLEEHLDLCDPDNATPTDIDGDDFQDGAPWVREMFDLCESKLPLAEDCPDALGQLVQ